MKLNIPWLLSCGVDRIILVIAAFVAGVVATWLVLRKPKEGFDGGCSRCGTRPCACSLTNKQTQQQQQCQQQCPSCPPQPDLSKYVLKSSVPPCPPMPDMTKYVLKSEVPPLPDMSRYVLKSSVPKCPPCIASCSKACEIGECPPCPRPRPRCPVPAPCPRTTCPPCPAIQPARCPAPDVSCKPVLNYTTGENRTPVRPVMASLGTFNL